MYKNGDICPICGLGNVKVKRKHESFKHKNKTLIIPLKVYSCNKCKEEFFDNKEMEKYNNIINIFIKEK